MLSARRMSRYAAISSLLLFTVLATGAHAATVSYFLNQSNVGPLPDGTNYLQVTISDGVAGAIEFQVDILQPLLDLAGASFGLNSFGFSTSGAATAANVTGLPANWTVNTNSNQDGFGRFELIPQTNGAGSRVSPTLLFSVAGITGDTINDYLVLSTNNAGQGNQIFAAHVAGFADLPSLNGTTSAYFGGSTPAPVPLPAAAWLMLSGVAAFGAVARRKIQN